MSLEGICVLPIVLVTLSTGTFVINYVVAVLQGHVDVIFPYISDSGTNPPESCIFGLMASITAMTGVATIYARYKLIEKLTERRTLVRPLVNQIALGIGLLSCLGICIVGTFQETVLRYVHDVGAGLHFVMAVLYMIMQTYISYRTQYGPSKALCCTRAIITSVACLALIPTIVCAILVKSQQVIWTGNEKEYGLHLASAVCEWVVAFSLVFYFLTYVHDFKLFTLTVKTELVEYN
ncbi:DNA damage-regulated autophagy modulator protein 1-like [Engraulis encrasicolus]|uniref:DNA damage-regulated autophagy modulator protein 1-like n=1 Tax=Engraulis encrasicolus TaxID=184585 RepID=UPI002FD279D0